jgi:hypothetical protein
MLMKCCSLPIYEGASAFSKVGESGTHNITTLTTYVGISVVFGGSESVRLPEDTFTTQLNNRSCMFEGQVGAGVKDFIPIPNSLQILLCRSRRIRSREGFWPL